jgi:hypothetical protein
LLIGSIRIEPNSEQFQVVDNFDDHFLHDKPSLILPGTDLVEAPVGVIHEVVPPGWPILLFAPPLSIATRSDSDHYRHGSSRESRLA